MSLYGRLIGAHHVEDAIVNVLRVWYPTYLHEAERVSGIVPGTLELPRSIRACLIQQSDTDEFLFRRDWVGEAYDVLPSIDDRTICVARVRLEIEVPDVLTSDAGPITPIVIPDDPNATPPVASPEWPVAVVSGVDLVKVPLEETP
jgi:hypothetical protein